MFYIFDFRRIKKAAMITLLLAVVILICRFVILPQYIFPKKYAVYIEKYAEKYSLDIWLVYAVVRVESNFETNAVSIKDARGLMQVSKLTGEWGASEIGLENFTVEDLFNPEINIEIGCWYLNRLIQQYDEKIDTALAAYNAGSGNVSKWLNNPDYSSNGLDLKEIPFQETSNYVKKVNFVKLFYEKLY